MHAGFKKESILPNYSEYEDCENTAVENHSVGKKKIKELEGMKTTLLNFPSPSTIKNRGQPV